MNWAYQVLGYPASLDISNPRVTPFHARPHNISGAAIGQAPLQFSLSRLPPPPGREISEYIVRCPFVCRPPTPPHRAIPGREDEPDSLLTTLDSTHPPPCRETHTEALPPATRAADPRLSATAPAVPAFLVPSSKLLRRRQPLPSVRVARSSPSVMRCVTIYTSLLEYSVMVYSMASSHFRGRLWSASTVTSSRVVGAKYTSLHRNLHLHHRSLTSAIGDPKKARK